jgi:hypothetical protein
MRGHFDADRRMMIAERVDGSPARLADAAGYFAWFDVADEMDGGLTLDDLSPSFVKTARKFAETFGVSFPARLAECEEVSNDFGRFFADLQTEAYNAPTKKAARR